MQYYIPKQSENFKIIQDFKALISEYNARKEQRDQQKHSFYDYDQLNSLDAVKRFLDYMLYDKTFGDDDMTEEERKELKESIINYYTARLYSYRGTLKTITILKEIENVLGITLGDIRYDTSKLELIIESIETSDITYFFSSLSDLVNNLLFFKRLDDEVNKVRVPLIIQSSPKVKMNAHFQSEFKVTEEIE